MKLENTLKYRSAWLGLAMLWVVLYHASPVVAGYSFFKNIGYGGVDICLFASGAGCYYSLSKSNNPVEFIKKRLVRIYPTYWCFLPFWFLYAFSAFKMTFPDVLGNIFGVQNFTGKGNAFNWYISAILLFYILAPYIQNVADRFDGVVKQALIIAVVFAISIPFWNSNTLIITVSRLPIFYIGILFAKGCKKNSSLSVKKIVLYIIAMAVGFAVLWFAFKEFRDYRWKNALYWYPFILITPGLCVGASLVMTLLDKCKLTSCIPKLLSLVGKYSLEIYLTHILIFDSVSYLVKQEILPNEKPVYILAVISIPFACAILNYLTKLVTKATSLIFAKKRTQ